MALTSILIPGTTQVFSVDAPIMIGASSTQSGSNQYRFQCEVKVSGASTSVTLSVPPNASGCGYFDVSKVCRDMLEMNPVIEQAVAQDDGSARRFELILKGRYLNGAGTVVNETPLTAVNCFAMLAKNMRPGFFGVDHTNGSPDYQSGNLKQSTSSWIRNENFKPDSNTILASGTHNQFSNVRSTSGLPFIPDLGMELSGDAKSSNNCQYLGSQPFTQVALPHTEDLSHKVERAQFLFYNAAGETIDEEVLTRSNLGLPSGAVGTVNWQQRVGIGYWNLVYHSAGMSTTLFVKALLCEYYSISFHTAAVDPLNQVGATLVFQSYDAVESDDCVPGTNILLYYRDALGSYQTIVMTGSRSQNLQASSKNFKPVAGNWNTAQASDQFDVDPLKMGARPYQTSSVRSWTLTSGWIPEQAQTQFEDLLTSPDTFLISNIAGAAARDVSRILISTKALTRRNFRDAKQINVTLTIQFANDQIT